MAIEIKLSVPENAIQLDRLVYDSTKVYIAKKTSSLGTRVFKLHYVSGLNYTFLNIMDSRQDTMFKHDGPRELINLMIFNGYRVYILERGLSYLKEIEDLEAT